LSYNDNESMKVLKDVKFIDLFAGIGSFHQALSYYGAKCVFASEWDKNCQEIYLKNYGILPEGDITIIPENEIPRHDILCAGFPCQAFNIIYYQYFDEGGQNIILPLQYIVGVEHCSTLLPQLIYLPLK